MWKHLGKLIIGTTTGMCLFFTGLSTMEGVIFRPDSTGKYVFSIGSIISYLQLPFNINKWRYAWGLLPEISLWTKIKLWNLNWVIMVTIGVCLIYLVDFISGLKYIA